MAKKKITAIDIISCYIEYVLENNKQPNSVYMFSKDYNFEEKEFYNFFGSFFALEKSIFKEFHNQTISLLEKSDDYNSIKSRDKLLTYYFSFFEILTVNRSYVIYSLESKKSKLKNLEVLKDFKKSFDEYISSLDIETIDLQKDSLNKIQEKIITESAWAQLMITLKFWLNDDSSNFEKTDILIEKSVKASFDLMDSTPTKSIIDLCKFLWKEKANMN